MVDIAVWQQGSGDGLCGIYCLANFLRDQVPFRLHTPKKLIFELIDEYDNYVSKHINSRRDLHFFCDGFEENDLVAVVQRVFDKHSMPFVSHNLLEYTVKSRRTDYECVISAIANGGGAVVDWEDEYHWVLAKNVVDSEIEIWDSDDRVNPVRRLSKRYIGTRRRRNPKPTGVLIFRRKLHSNAQTH